MRAQSFTHDIEALFGAIAPPRQTPMQHQIWLRACALATNPNGDIEIVSAGPAGRPSAAAAFIKSGRLSPRLNLLGAEELWMPTDVHYKDEHSANELADALVKKGLPARFGHFPAGSKFVAALTRASRGSGYVMSSPVPGVYYIPLDETWRQPEQKLRSKRRSDLRRRRKKAEALGHVSFEIVCPEPAAVDALIDEAFAVEASGWKGRSGTALALDEKQNAFFRHYGRLASDVGILRLCFMRIDGKPVAATIAAECDGAFWQFKIGYDETYKECSPSKLLLAETVAHAAQAGLSAYEFLGNAPWIEEWTSDIRPSLRLRYYPFNPAGAAAIVSDALHAGAKRIIDRVQAAGRGK